jgi:hypothetical protein
MCVRSTTLLVALFFYIFIIFVALRSVETTMDRWVLRVVGVGPIVLGVGCDQWILLILFIRRNQSTFKWIHTRTLSINTADNRTRRTVKVWLNRCVSRTSGILWQSPSPERLSVVALRFKTCIVRHVSNIITTTRKRFWTIRHRMHVNSNNGSIDEDDDSTVVHWSPAPPRTDALVHLCLHANVNQEVSRPSTWTLNIILLSYEMCASLVTNKIAVRKPRVIVVVAHRYSTTETMRLKYKRCY